MTIERVYVRAQPVPDWAVLEGNLKGLTTERERKRFERMMALL